MNSIFQEDEKSPSESGRRKRENPDPTDPSDIEAKGQNVLSWSGDVSSQRTKRCDRSEKKASSEPGLKRENPEPTSEESLKKDEEDPTEFKNKELENFSDEANAGLAAIDRSWWKKKFYEERKEDIAAAEANAGLAAIDRFWAESGAFASLRKTGLPPLDDQYMILSGEEFLSVLDVLYKRFLNMAEELVAQELVEEEKPSLVELAGHLLGLIEKPNTDKGELDETAKKLMGNKKVLDALVEHANLDPHFVDVGSCLNHVLYLKEKEPGIENVVRLRDDTVFDSVVKNQDKGVNMLRGALSVVFGYWFDESFCDHTLTKHKIHLNWGLSASFLLLDEDFEEDREVMKELLLQREIKRRQREIKDY